MKRAVIFDIDGTLLDTERIYMEGWRQGGALLGFPVSNEALIKTRALSREAAIPVYKKYCGQDFPYEEVRAHRTRIAEQMIASSTPEQLWMPHMRETLEQLRQKGYLIGAATSTRLSFTLAHLKQAGILDYFQAISTGDMVENGKPAPDIFLLAAQKLGCRPEECVAVGDTPADVLAGFAAGMEVYLIPDQVPAIPETRAKSRVLEHLGQLIPAMEESV